MLIYWSILLVALSAALVYSRPRLAGLRPEVSSWSVLWVGAWLGLTLVIGLRYEVGADWPAYEAMVRAVSGLPLWQALDTTDPAYAALNWVGANVGGGVLFVNTVCAALFSWGLIAFCRLQPRPWLALLVAVPYLVIVVAMGYTRQGVALGLAMLGLTALLQGRLLGFVLWVAVAAMFHKSAAILIPLAVFVGSDRQVVRIIGVVFAAALLFFLLLLEYIDELVVGYLAAGMDSAGAWVRVIMNAMPAALFLLLRKRFQCEAGALKFWTWFSLAGLAFIPLLMVSPSSTAVDRLALYWMPLQVFVLSRLPDVFGTRSGTRIYWVVAVVLLAAAVQFVWLFFAAHAHAWLPYQFYPWVWLWSL